MKEDMNHLTVKVSQRHCVFVLQIDNPTDTLRKLAHFFQDMRIVIQHFNLHRNQDGTAMVIAHCLIRKDLVEELTAMLGQLPGVNEVELMEGR